MSQVDAGTLWKRFHGELLAFLRPRVPSDAAAEDLLHEAFLRAHRHLVAGEVPENPRAWLYRITRNLIVDAHRRAGRRNALVEAAAAEPTVPTGPTTEPDPVGVEHDAFAMVARSLPMFIDALDPPYRDALRMTELEGLTQAEAAARVGISLSGMKSRVQRGRKQIFDALHRCCDFVLDSRGHVIDCALRGRPVPCC